MDIQETPQPETGVAAPVQNIWRRLWNFSKEIWNDHDFWIRALAVKGAASGVVVAGIVGISYVTHLPLLLATAGISVCAGFIGVGLYGVFLGAAGAKDKLAAIWSKTILNKPPRQKKPSIKRLQERLLENPRFKKFLARPLTQKFLSSRPWKAVRTLTQKPQDVFLAGLAGTGSIFWGTVSAVALAAVLPVVTAASLFTFGTVLALGGFMSGAYGIYLSAQSLVKSFRAKKKPAESAKLTAEPMAPSQKSLTAELTPAFTQAQEKTEKVPLKPVSQPPPPAP
jgi:hypothetical protein